METDSNSLRDDDSFPAADVFTVRTSAAPLVTANLMPALRDLCNGEPSGMKKTMPWSPEGVALRNIGLARWVAAKQEQLEFEFEQLYQSNRSWHCRQSRDRR
jgi:hypothetical protein